MAFLFWFFQNSMAIFNNKSIFFGHLFLFFIGIALPLSLGAQDQERDSLLAAYHQANYRLEKNTMEIDSSYINLLNQLARTFRYKKSDSLGYFAEEALKQSKRIGYAKGEMEATMELANYYSDLGKQALAIKYFNRSLAISKKIEEKDTQLSIMSNLGHEYAYQGQLDRSLKTFLEAIDLAEKEDNNDMLSILHEAVAQLYIEQEDYPIALAQYKIIDSINTVIGNPVFQAETWSNLASVYSKTGQSERALETIDKSIAIFKEEGITDWLAYAYSVKGEVYEEKGNYHWSLHWYDKCRQLHVDLDDPRSEIELYQGLAKTYYGLKGFDQALQYGQKALGIAQQINDFDGQKTTTETLYKIHQARGEYDLAFEHLEWNKLLTDSLTKIQLKNMQELYQTDTAFRVNATKDKQFIERENKQKARLALAVFIVVIVLLVSVYFMIKNHKKLTSLFEELKVKTQNLRNRENELREISRARDRLFSIIGHDLRSPIGALQGMLNLLDSGEIAKQEFIAFIPKLKGDVDHISFTLNNLLSWGQAQMDSTITKSSTVTVARKIEDQIRLLADAAEKKNIKVINEVTDDTKVWADTHHVDLIVRNLLSNALKFTPNHGLISFHAEDRKGYWQLCVKDTGIGMDEETLSTLFMKETNRTTYGTNNEKGTGLGLALCRELVQRNNGDLWVESELKKGSRFYFTLLKKEVRKFRKETAGISEEPSNASSPSDQPQEGVLS